MKKILMGLAAILATSFAVPAFADDAKPAEGGEKKAKKSKKGKKADEKAPEGGGTPAPAPAK
jgi:hypothetical protein